MLILQRNLEQKIVVDGPCVIQVTRIMGDKVWLGFDAPQSTTVLREELVDAYMGDSTGDGIRDSAGLGGGLGVEAADAE